MKNALNIISKVLFVISMVVSMSALTTVTAAQVFGHVRIENMFASLNIPYNADTVLAIAVGSGIVFISLLAIREECFSPPHKAKNKSYMDDDKE